MRRPAGRPLGYQPGIDGLRGLSVVAVILYHADLGLFAGGFIGVEVFFVISGFLIAALLLEEQERSGFIDLRGFWVRRARRLLPALGLVLVVTSLIAVWIPDLAYRQGADVLAALGYVSNWAQIARAESYFSQFGRPPLLRHLWSLAVEEQFYLLFPVFFAVGLRRLGERLVLRVVLGAALVSTVLMGVLFHPGSDPSRVYYGTDTRLAGPLIGVAVALVWRPWQETDRRMLARLHRMDVAAVLALLGLLWSAHSMAEKAESTFRGGFLIMDLLTAVVIAAVVVPGSALGHLLGHRALRWVGVRSYGLYLWHWPVFVLLRPGHELPSNTLVGLVIRLAITGVVAECSYRVVELPIRRGVLSQIRHAYLDASLARQLFVRRRLAVAGGVVGVLTLACGAGLVAAAGHPPKDRLTEKKLMLAPPTNLPPVAPQPPSPATGTWDMQGRGVLFLGDSVMKGSSTYLTQMFPQATVDAQVSRWFRAMVDRVAEMRAAGNLPPVLVIHGGNNGGATAEEIERLMGLVAGHQVLFVNLRATGMSWPDKVNPQLAALAASNPDVGVIDWHSLAESHPEWFWDGLHLKPSGAEHYLELIHQALSDLAARQSAEPATPSSNGEG